MRRRSSVFHFSHVNKSNEPFGMGRSIYKNRRVKTQMDNQYEDSEMDDGGIEVDWEGMYKDVKSEISKLMQEGKYKNEKYEEETKRLREIPLEERIKIVGDRFEKIGRIKAVSDEEAVRKYISDKKDQKKCLRILEGVRKGKKKIIDYDEYSSKGFLGLKRRKRGNYLLSKAAKQAIDVNDVPSLKALSKGCFLPSNKSITANIGFGKRRYSLFEYSCGIHADDCALYLIEEGGGIKQKFEDKTRPLVQALSGRNEDIFNFLRERGDDIEAVDEGGKTPLYRAAKENNFEVAKLLIERGVDIEAGGKQNFRTPLYVAAFNNSIEVAKLLIEKGANIEVKDYRGYTPLHWAAYNNFFEIAQLLIERGADIEAKSIDGDTVLYNAAVGNSCNVALLLIEKGAKTNVKNNKGNTPLNVAIELNNFDVANLLKLAK